MRAGSTPPPRPATIQIPNTCPSSHPRQATHCDVATNHKALKVPAAFQIIAHINLIMHTKGLGIMCRN